MPELPNGFALKMLFASLAMSALGIAGAKAVMQVMPAEAPASAEVPQAAPASPAAEAVIPPAIPLQPQPPKPAEKPVVTAAATHHAPPAHHAKFTAMVKHLAAAHPRPEHAPATIPVKAPMVEQPQPPVPMPPPGYYDPGPYQRLVYGGPPPGLYGGWGYRGRFYP